MQEVTKLSRGKEGRERRATTKCFTARSIDSVVVVYSFCCCCSSCCCLQLCVYANNWETSWQLRLTPCHSSGGEHFVLPKRFMGFCNFNWIESAQLRIVKIEWECEIYCSPGWLSTRVALELSRELSSQKSFSMSSLTNRKQSHKAVRGGIARDLIESRTDLTLDTEPQHLRRLRTANSFPPSLSYSLLLPVRLWLVVLLLAFLPLCCRFNYAKLTLINLGWRNNKEHRKIERKKHNAKAADRLRDML